MAETSLPKLTSKGLGSGRGRILFSLVGCHTINDFYSLVIPLMMPGIQQSFGLSYFAVAIVPFLMQVTSALLQPTLGYLADRKTARQRALALGFAVLAVGMIWLSQSRSYPLVLVAAILLGLGGSTYHPQSATLLAYYFDRKVRGFAQGIHGIGNAAGFVLAPIVVGLLIKGTDWHVAAAWLSLPAIVGVGIVMIALAEPDLRGHSGLLAGITRHIALLTLVTGLALATSTGFVSWLPTYYVAHGYSLANSALLTAPMSAAAFLAQPLGGAISDRFGRRNLLSYALGGTAISLLVFLMAPSITWAIGLSVLVGFWSSLIPPVAMVYASELAAGERTGTAVGTVWGLGTSIAALALPVTGRIIDLAGGQIAPAYLALVALAVLAGVLARWLPHG